MTTSNSERRFRRHDLTSAADVAAVRSEFRRWLSSLTDDEERVAEVTIVLSELGSNAVEATPENRPPARVEAWLASTGCTIEVRNHLGDSTTPDPGWDLDDPLRSGGRGLMLVSAFTDDVEIEAEHDEVTVRCTAALGDTRPAG